MRRLIFGAIIITAAIALIAGCGGVGADPPAGEKTFRWTAPGDDGVYGQASEYDLRWTTDNSLPFDQWNQAPGEPSPSLAGQTDSCFVDELPTSVPIYAVIRASDEVPNWSAWSNILEFQLDDITPPNMINDLR